MAAVSACSRPLPRSSDIFCLLHQSNTVYQLTEYLLTSYDQSIQRFSITMTSWITFLVGIIACLGFALAAPVEETASDVTPVSRITIETKLHTDALKGVLRGQGPYPYSLQIQVSEVKPFYYVWDIFQGPSGIAVYPCGDTRFEKVYHGEPGWHTDKLDMVQPPFPQNYEPFVPEVS